MKGLRILNSIIVFLFTSAIYYGYAAGIDEAPLEESSEIKSKTDTSVHQRATDNQLVEKKSEQRPEIVTYKSFLEKLDKSKKESILIAKDKFLELFSSDKQNYEDAFRNFRTFYKSVIEEHRENFYNNINYQGVLAEISIFVRNYPHNPLPALEKLNNRSANEIKAGFKDILKELNEYRKCGMDFSAGEGDWYLVEDPDFLVNILSDFSGELKEYLVFYANEVKERLIDDAALLVSWEDLRKRIIRWEKFANKHPNLLETETEIKGPLQSMFHIYLCGNIVQAYKETGEKRVALRKSYEAFLKENSTSSYYSIINDVYNILEKHDFRFSRELILFLNDQGCRYIVSDFQPGQERQDIQPKQEKVAKKAYMKHECAFGLGVAILHEKDIFNIPNNFELGPTLAFNLAYRYNLNEYYALGYHLYVFGSSSLDVKIYDIYGNYQTLYDIHILNAGINGRYTFSRGRLQPYSYLAVSFLGGGRNTKETDGIACRGISVGCAIGVNSIPLGR